MATENAVMTYNDAGYQLPLTISGSGNYNYLLRTKDTYLNKDITITTSTAAAVPEADNANADVTLFTTDGSNAGVNISAIVGTKATAEPTSGYYLAFKGSGRSKITTAGWIGTGALNTSTSDAKYFPITTANGSITKVSQSLTPTASLEKSNTLTWSDSDTSGISVTAKGNASGSLSARIDISQAGYVPKGNNWKSGSLTISAAGTPASAIKYLTAVDIASGKSFTITNAGTLTVTSTGTTTVTSNSTSAGTIAIKAKVTADDNDTTNANVVENGLWKTVSMAAANTAYYGRVTASALTITTSSTNDGMSTYFNTGSSSDKNVTITPKYTNTAGFKTATTTATNNGGTTYWKIKTVTPTFAAAPGGGSTASSSQITMDTTSTSAGIEIQTAYTINAATITYKAAATGWIDKTKDASTGSSTTAKSSTNGTKYYVTGVTVPASKSLAIANSGTVTVTSGSTSAGTVTIVAKKTANDSSNTTANIITNGLWQQATIKSPNTTATLGDPTYISDSNNTNYQKFTITASGTIAKPTVNPAGYVNGDDTIGVRQTGTISGTKVLNRVTVGTTISSGSSGTVTPEIKRTAIPSGDQWTDAASGAATTTKPTSGVYVRVDADAKAKTIGVKGTVTAAGYGTTSYYGQATEQSITAGSAAAASAYIPIKTATPAFDGGGLSGTATASSSTASISDSTNSSGVSFTTACTATRANVLYNGAVNGWVTKADDSVALSSDSKALTGKTYYINSVTVASGKTFSVTNNGTTNVTNNSTTTVTSGIASSTPKGTINVNAYPASGTTLDGSKKIVENGRWITTSVSAGGTYYGKVTIGTASFSNTATNNVTYTDYDANAPIIPSGGYLYINAGYTPARKISLAKLVPNEVTVGETVEDPLIHPTCTAYNVKGEVVVGTMVIYGGDYTITT